MFPSSKGKSRQFRKKTHTEDDASTESTEIKPETSTTTQPQTTEGKDETSVNNNGESKDNEEDDFELKLKQREQRKAKKKDDSSKDKKPTQQAKSLLSFAEEQAEIEEPVRITAVGSKSKDKGKKKQSRPLLRDMSSTEAPVLQDKPVSTWAKQTSYSQERLEELKKNSMNYVPKNSNEERTADDIDMEIEPLEDNVPMQEATILNTNQVEQMEEKEEEEDEDFKRWELEQIKKGGGGQFRTNEIDNDKATKAIAKLQQPKKEPKKIPLLSPLTPSSRVSVDEMQRRLRSSLTTLTDEHKLHLQQLDEAKTKIESAKAEIENLNSNQKGISDQYIFYREMRDYISDLCDCLGEKAPAIEECEEQLLKLEVQRMEKLEYKGEALWSEIETSKTDPQFAEPKEALLRAAENVFNDTAEDFASIQAIKDKFEYWKFNHPQSYKDAYCSVGLPTLFAPFVRLELLRWDPFETPSFDHLKWYDLLFNYGIRKGVNVDPSDEDLNLVPQIVEKVIAPKVTALIASAWNPRLISQNKKATELVKQLLIYLDPKSSAIKELLSAVVVAAQGISEGMPLLRDESSKHAADLYIKFIGNMSMWSEYLAPEALNRIVVDNLINMKLISYANRLKSKEEATDVLERLLKCLPAEWIARGKHGKLALLHNTIVNMAKKLDANSDTLHRIKKMLVELGDRETAQKLGQK